MAVIAEQWRCHRGSTNIFSHKYYECFAGEQGKGDRLDTQSEILHISARREDYSRPISKYAEEREKERGRENR